MSRDACPYCGAPGIDVQDKWYLHEWRCGTFASRANTLAELSWGRGTQSPECARYVRVRISQLRRMARCADKRMDELLDLDADDNGFSQGFYWRWFGRFTAFRDACLREVERLRGGA